MKGAILVSCMAFVAWSLELVQAEHKVVAVVLKNPNFKGAPVLKLNAHNVLSAPSNQASVQQTTPLVANAVQPVDTPNYVANDAAPVPVIEEKPKKVIRYKLIRMSDEDIKKEAEAKKLKQLKDAQEAKLKKVLYPCRDYSPICSWYKNMWNPAIAQCRDVWMQRNCRETCGLCRIPIGVYLACQDMQHCKKLGTHSCVHDWVKETCKTMCGGCDGSKGGSFARVGASSVFVGKKKSMVEAKKEKKEDEKGVHTVHQAVKLQAKPINVKADSNDDDHDDVDDSDDTQGNESGNNHDDKEKDDDDDDDDDNDMEKQPADSNMENESGDDEEASNDKPEPEPEVVKEPAKHASVPKVAKKADHKPAVQKPAAPKVHHHHKKTKTAKKVVHDQKPAVKKVQQVKKIHDKKTKKAKNPVKALVTKHKKQVKVVHDKKTVVKKEKTVKKTQDKAIKKN